MQKVLFLIFIAIIVANVCDALPIKLIVLNK